MTLQKRARVLLSAVAILAIAGGALAFKARVNNPVYCSDAATTSATSLKTGWVDTTLGGDLSFCTTIQGATANEQIRITTTTPE